MVRWAVRQSALRSLCLVIRRWSDNSRISATERRRATPTLIARASSGICAEAFRLLRAETVMAIRVVKQADGSWQYAGVPA